MESSILQRDALKRSAQRRIRATARYFRLIVTRFWRPCIIIFVLLMFGMLMFHRCYMKELGRYPDYTESLFATYSLFGLQTVYQIPAAWLLRVMYFTYPLIG